MADAKIVLTAVDQTKAAFDSAKRNMAGIGDTVTRVTGLMGALGATAAGAFAINKFAGALNLLDQLDDMAEKTGVSVESLSKLRYAGEVTGTSLEQLSGGMTRLAKLMGEASSGSEEAVGIFKTLGVSFRDAGGQLRGTDEVLKDVATRFASWEDGAGKAAWAMKVFGKSGQDMIPLLNRGAIGIDELSNEADKFGALVGGDAARAAAEFNDNLTRIRLTSEAAAVSIAGPLVSSVNDVAQAFINAKKEGDGLSGMMSRFVSKLPQIPDFLANASPQLRMLKMAQEAGSMLEGQTADAARELQRNNEKRLSLSGLGEKQAPPPTPDKPAKASDFAANFLNSLTTAYANLTGELTKTDEVQRQLKLNGDKFTQTQREQALALAGLIDAQKAKRLIDESEIKGLQERTQLNEQLEAAYAAQKLALLTYGQDLQFEASLIGKTADEVARLRFERELDLKTRAGEDVLNQQLERGLITAEAFKTELAQLRRLAAAASLEFGRVQADLWESQNEPMRGMRDGLRDYWDDAQKLGEKTKNAVTSAFRGMEDAMVQFVRTGKMDFKSLADSIISDLIRIAVQQAIVGPLANSLGGMFGSRGQMTVNSSAQPLDSSFDQYLVTTSANGNVMTPYGPMALNTYANGGIATSPQISIFGEGRMNEAYVPLPDGRTIPVTMRGASGEVTVNVINQGGGLEVAGQRSTRNADGSMTVDVMVRQIQDAMADNVAAGSGSLFNAIGSRFQRLGTA